MARRRYVSTNVSIDGRLNRAAMQHGDFVALLYTWMIPHAGDDGTLRGDPDEIMAQVFPLRRDLDGPQVRRGLEILAGEDCGLITWDDAAKVVTFPYAAFYGYQTYIKEGNRRRAREEDAGGEGAAFPGEMRGSAASGAEMRDSAAFCGDNSANQRKTPQITASPSFSPSLPVSPSPSLSPSPPPPGEGVTATTPKRADARHPLPSSDDLVALLGDWAATKGVAVTLREEVEAFRDYCLTKIDPATGWLPGTRKLLYADYAAGCRRWITNPDFAHPARAPARASPVGQHPSNEQTKFSRSVAALQGVGGPREPADIPDQHGEAGRRLLRRDHAREG